MNAPITKRELFRLAMRERSDPEPYYEKLAIKTIADFSLPLQGRKVLDLGCGGGYDARALQHAGAVVSAMDLGLDCVESARDKGISAFQADALQTPFADATFDGVYCSNIVEHVPSVPELLDEIGRVLRPGGWGWISWTNWFSPWGGHHMIPFHMLGPQLGSRVYTRLFGVPEKNALGDGLYPTYIGKTLQMVEQSETLALVSAVPRYYSSQQWILNVPGLREVVTWNCVLTVQRR